MSNGQRVWFITCIIGIFFWLTCGFAIFPFNFIFVMLTGIVMIPCFIKGQE